ncbi:MAG: GNAT family N-acetyltransferase [Sneathiella sp.]
MEKIDIRAVTREEFSIAVDWAATEGWNPGLNDLKAFYAADPNGFFMGFVQDKPVSSLSVVRYEQSYGFLGFYIVLPEFRGQGIGIATWNKGLEHLAGRTIGLDGVVDQQDNYRKSGFILQGRNIRYTGVPLFNSKQQHELEIRDIMHSDMEALLSYDCQFFSVRREGFLNAWLEEGNLGKKATRIALKNSEICGFGTIRECRDGFKVGPLFSEDPRTADALLTALCATLPEGTEISLDTPEDNSEAVALAREFGLKPSFETARMYKGDVPDLPIDKIYGITTFELG